MAERINYSDKTVSKWERGEALPDLRVLSQMSELFGVDLGYFITEHTVKQPRFIFSGWRTCLRVTVILLASLVLCLISAVIAAFLIKYVM